MAYIIKNADGTVLLNLVDGTTDAKTTSLTLIGKNTDAYGTALNTNLVNILQNFASVSQPRSPLIGQLWYNKADGRMKVFTLDGVFKEIAASILSDQKPTTLKQGDLWIDTANDQLYFTKDGINTVLAGPIYSGPKGKSGWVVETFLDAESNQQTVSSLYSNNVLLGMLSSSTFSLAAGQDVQGMGEITTGLTLNTSIQGIRFAGTATNATAVLGVAAEDYLLNNNGGNNQQIIGSGSLTLLSDAGLDIGLYRDLSLFTNGSVGSRGVIFRNNIVDGATRFVTVKSYPSGPDAQLTTLFIKGDQVGVNTVTPNATLHVAGSGIFNGNVSITGDLTVVGTQTIMNTVMLAIQDKNIELASSSTGWYTDMLIEGGGITLKGTTDKTILYNNSSTSWKSNINYDLIGLRSYCVEGVSVLSSSTLGNSVINSSLTRVGVLSELTVTNVVVKGSGITTGEAEYEITAVSSVSTGTTGSAITIRLGSIVPIISAGTTVVVDGIADTEYNNTYIISTLTNYTTSTEFVVLSPVELTTTSPLLGANPIVTIKDLMISSSQNGDIDVTGHRIKNLQYSTVPSDAATVQFALDSVSIQSLKGFVITLDITNMATPDSDIAALLNALAPPVNNPPPEYPSDTQYDLPVGYRARVLVTTNSIPVQAQPIVINKTDVPVQRFPDSIQVSAISNIAITTVGVVTTATYTYGVKEFRVIAGPPAQWEWYRDISV